MGGLNRKCPKPIALIAVTLAIVVCVLTAYEVWVELTGIWHYTLTSTNATSERLQALEQRVDQLEALNQTQSTRSR